MPFYSMKKKWVKDLQYSYKNLSVWQSAMDLAVFVYRTTSRYPVEERFNLTDQMRRAAVSIPSNIAEERNRGSDVEFKRFIHIARGSCAELDTQFILSYKLAILSEEGMKEGTARCLEISNKLTKLAASLK